MILPSKDSVNFSSSNFKKADGIAKTKISYSLTVLLISLERSNCSGCSSAELK